MILKEKSLNGGIQIVHKFPNGYGASVVQGPYTYGGEDGLWEIAVLKFKTDKDWGITYDTPLTDDVLGYLTDNERDNALKAIEALPNV